MTTHPHLEGLIRKWESRSRESHPSDAMLINLHVRELREALAALPGGGVACGGCGETNPAKRCVGCLHQFTPTWRPIETAPERGSFLIYGGEWVGESGRRYKSEIAQVNRANGGKFYLADAEDFWPWVESATHWMPNPQAPALPTPNPHEADRNE